MAARARRILILTATLLVIGSVLAPSSFAARRDAGPPPAYPTLYVVYAMNCTFHVEDDFGRTVTSIAPGTYQVEVSTPIMFKLVRPGGPGVDHIAADDFTGCKGWVQFQLTGPGVDLFTTLDSGCDAFLLLPVQTFRAGATYTLQDLNQPAVTRTQLTVQSQGNAPTPSNPYGTTSGEGHTIGDLVGSKAPIGVLAGLLDKTGKASLTKNGKALLSVKAGRYRFEVTDQSKTRGFTLAPVEGKLINLTGGKFVGKHRGVVNLREGRWSYQAGNGKTYFFLVTK
jgi:hypothetical protein